MSLSKGPGLFLRMENEEVITDRDPGDENDVKEARQIMGLDPIRDYAYGRDTLTPAAVALDARVADTERSGPIDWLAEAKQG